VADPAHEGREVRPDVPLVVDDQDRRHLIPSAARA
jgi:hypothetical protein